MVKCIWVEAQGWAHDLLPTAWASNISAGPEAHLKPWAGRALNGLGPPAQGLMPSPAHHYPGAVAVARVTTHGDEVCYTCPKYTD